MPAALGQRDRPSPWGMQQGGPVLASLYCWLWTGSISGWGRSAGEGIGYPLQYSWASLVAQLIKNPPAMQETWVKKIPWRKERLPTPVFWPGEFHGLYSPWGCKESDTTERLSLQFISLHFGYSSVGFIGPVTQLLPC